MRIIHLFSILLQLSLFCQSSSGTETIRILIEQLPSQLNPYQITSWNDERFSELLFTGLIEIDKDLQPTKGLARSWVSSTDHLQWILEPSAALSDTLGSPITSKELFLCLENYRKNLTPVLMPYFESWKSTELKSSSIILTFTKPTPFFPFIAHKLKFFRISGESTPCALKLNARNIIPSGRYQPVTQLLPQWTINSDSYEVVERDQTNRVFQFGFSRFETSRALLFKRGDFDATFNAFSASKVHWLIQQRDHSFVEISRPGTSLDYLAFNFNHPALSKPIVRRALALAIDRERIIKFKFYNQREIPHQVIATPFISKRNSSLPYDVSQANVLLDGAGYPRDPKTNIRFALQYLTTSSPIGFEKALLIRDALRAIGVDLKLKITEPAQYHALLKTKGSDLYSTRLVGIHHPIELKEILTSEGHLNRMRFRSKTMDSLFKALLNISDQREILEQMETTFWEDLPFFPLWTWNHSLITKSEIRGVQATDLYQNGSLKPLFKLTKNPPKE